MKGNVINLNTLHLNSVRLNGIGKVQSVSLKGGSTEDPVFPPVEPPVEPTPTYTLSASVTNGKVSAKRNGSAVNLPFTANEGDAIVLEVTPNDGYSFEGWNDGNTDNPRSITMTADVALSAQCVEVVQPPVGNYIQFEDPAVEAICVANWSSDGIGLTEEDAAAVTSIGTVFKDNKNIQSFNELVLFTGVKTISAQAFRRCTNLKSIDLTNVQKIEYAAFAQSGLEGDIVCPSLQFITSTGDWDSPFHSTKIKKVLDLGSITSLFNGHNASSGGVFAYASELTYANLPPTLTLLGRYTFYGCSALETIICRATTPPTLGNYAFGSTNDTFLIYVPDASVEAYKTAVNWSAYASRIHPLSEIEGSPYIQFEDAEVGRILMANGVSSDGIGITKEDAAAVTTIGTWFKGNTAITSFDELKYFINVKALSTSYAFSGCTNLQRVNLENIESMNSQVFNNSGIVELILPKIKSLVNSALVDMKSVTKVVIGASCESIEPNNIWSWGDRNSVAFILEGTTPPSVATSNNKPDWYGVKFYVPDEAVEAYKAAAGWASWAGRIYPVSEYNG